jgi:hypothetical protein
MVVELLWPEEEASRIAFLTPVDGDCLETNNR